MRLQLLWLINKSALRQRKAHKVQHLQIFRDIYAAFQNNGSPANCDVVAWAKRYRDHCIAKPAEWWRPDVPELSKFILAEAEQMDSMQHLAYAVQPVDQGNRPLRQVPDQSADASSSLAAHQQGLAGQAESQDPTSHVGQQQRADTSAEEHALPDSHQERTATVAESSVNGNTLPFIDDGQQGDMSDTNFLPPSCGSWTMDMDIDEPMPLTHPSASDHMQTDLPESSLGQATASHPGTQPDMVASSSGQGAYMPTGMGLPSLQGNGTLHVQPTAATVTVEVDPEYTNELRRLVADVDLRQELVLPFDSLQTLTRLIQVQQARV